jgi:CspA family cold shock protein
MPTGTVKWFNGQALRLHHAGLRRARTYSFHQSGVAAGRPLKEGARVSFDAEQGDKGPGAVNVREL